MSLLRYIDAEGREQDVHDVNHLYELIQQRHVGYDSLVWDEEEARWLAARDHKLFRRIREIAAASPPPLQPWSIPAPQPSVPTAQPRPQTYKSLLMQHRNQVPDEPASEKPTTKSKWFNTIQSRDEALKTIKESSSVFCFIAVLQGALGTWMATQYPDSGFDLGETIIDVALYAGCAAWLRWGRSRIAAVLLLITATIALGTTIAAQLKIIQGGGKNVVVALIVVWAAIKGVEATFKLRGRFKQPETTTQPQLG